jgi:hypothetical protein
MVMGWRGEAFYVEVTVEQERDAAVFSWIVKLVCWTGVNGFMVTKMQPELIKG